MTIRRDVTVSQIRGTNLLTAYLDEKEAMGLLCRVMVVPTSTPKAVSIQARLHAGVYREVVEPWLRGFAQEIRVLCVVSALSLSGSGFTRQKLWRLCPDVEVGITIETVPSAREEGVFRYV